MHSSSLLDNTEIVYSILYHLRNFDSINYSFFLNIYCKTFFEKSSEPAIKLTKKFSENCENFLNFQPLLRDFLRSNLKDAKVTCIPFICYFSILIIVFYLTSVAIFFITNIIKSISPLYFSVRNRDLGLRIPYSHIFQTLSIFWNCFLGRIGVLRLAASLYFNIFE